MKVKTRLLALVLVLASALGLFGCAAIGGPAQENGAAVPDNFIGANGDGLLSNTEEVPENLVNIAGVDGNEKPIFQIVYDLQASLRVQEQCETLAADIYEATGVTVPVVHSSLPQKTYEIMVGNVKRKATIEKMDELNEKLEANDFAVCVVGTRVVIYAKNDAAMVSAMYYFMDQLVYRSEMQGIYGVKDDTDFIYHPSGEPTVKIEPSEDDRYVELVMQDGVFKAYVRLSYTGNKGWRIQTKHREAEAFRELGAAQQLAYSLGEYKPGVEDERFYTEKLTTSKVGDVLRVESDGSGYVEITTEPFGLKFYTKQGALSAEITDITCNAGGSSITGTLNEGEGVFGTGERFDATNQRGKKIEMWSTDFWSREDACYMVIPLLCFTRGSGVFINNYEHMVVDLDSAKKNEWNARITGAPLDCYIYTTEQIEEVIHNYSGLSGYANLPEEWTYGMIVCAYGPDFSQKWTADITPSEEDGRGEGVYEMIANMEANDLPWTGVLAEGWGPYVSTKHRDLKELCDYVHSLGKKFIVYMRVGDARSSMKGYNSSYLLTQTRSDGTVTHNLPDTTKDTNNPDVLGGGIGTADQTHVYVDVTNPAAVEWFFNDYWDYLSNDIGVDGCKIDFCETLPENYELNYFDDTIPTAGSHHWYPSAFCAMFYDMLAKKPDGGMNYTRGGGIGSQRAPFMWAGDQFRHWKGIRWQLTGALSSGLSGVPYMSYDMSGYQYGNGAAGAVNREIANESKVFLRGTLYSAFTVCMQTHGKVRRSYQFAEYTDEKGDHPYAYVTDIYRAYTKLHEHLTPYITELCEEASATGVPVMRHLVLGWQDDANVYNVEDEFMMGDAFLIAPILTDTESRSVYLPEGKWKDLNTGAIHNVGEAGETINVTANIAELPSFFNMDTESEIARELVDGIMELYDYAGTFVPAK